MVMLYRTGLFIVMYALVGLMIRMLTMMEELKQTQQVLLSMQQQMLRQMDQREEMQALPEGIDVPLTSMDDFDNFEIKAEDAAFQKAMVNSCIV